MDSFKEMAEEKMREAVSQQIQGEIDADENELRAREQEFSSSKPRTPEPRSDKSGCSPFPVKPQPPLALAPWTPRHSVLGLTGLVPQQVVHFVA